MSFGFEEPTIHNVIEITAEYDAGISFGPVVGLTFKGRGSYYDNRIEEATIGIHFAKTADARKFAEAFAAAINALTELPAEEDV